MNICQPYDRILTGSNTYSILKSGRDAGKSKFLAQLIVIYLFKYLGDILVTRSDFSALETSMFNEILEVIDEEGFNGLVEVRKRPLKIVNKSNGNTVHFKGIGGADLSRTKGFKPNAGKDLTLIVVDETQQLPRQSNLDQALASFRRHLDHKVAKIVLAFNPEPQNSHWMNEYYRLKEMQEDYLCVHTSYKDIAHYLTPLDLKAILDEKKYNESYYRYLYLGETNGLFGAVYHSFDRDIHVITKDELKLLTKTIGVFSVLVGVDGATTRDKTAFVPVIILRNGQAVTSDVLFYDPERWGAISNEQLFPLVEKWFENFKLTNSIGFSTPIHFIVDSASADLRVNLQYNLPKRYKVWAYSQKNIIEMAQKMQDAFSRNILLITQNGGYTNWKNRMFIKGEDPLITQLESVVWDEEGKKFDSRVPNDVTDALTYALSFYLKNPQNIYLPNRISFYERKVVDTNE